MWKGRRDQPGEIKQCQDACLVAIRGMPLVNVGGASEGVAVN